MEERITSATRKQDWVLTELAQGDVSIITLSHRARIQRINNRTSCIDDWAAAPVKQLCKMGLAVRIDRRLKVYGLTAKGRAWARAMGTALAA